MAFLYLHPQQPPSGHWFPDPSGYTIRAKSLKELVEAVKSYRAANCLPLGNPEADVERFYARQWPWLVDNRKPITEAEESPHSAWLNRIWRNPPRKWARDDEHGSRMAICAQCPHYVDLMEISQEERRRVAVISSGRSNCLTGYCTAHHWICGLAAWMQKPEQAQAISGCWNTEASSVGERG